MEKESLPTSKAPVPGCLWIYLLFFALPGVVVSLARNLFPDVLDRSSSWYWLQELFISLGTIFILSLIWWRFPRFSIRMDYLEHQVVRGAIRAWSPQGLGIIFGFFEIMALNLAFHEGWRAFFIGTVGSFLIALYLWSIASWSDTFSKRERKPNFFDACLLLVVIAGGFLGIGYLIYVMTQIVR